MVSPVASSYSVSAGQPIYAGRLRSGFVAGAVLGASVSGGALAAVPSMFVAGATQGASIAAGPLESLDYIKAPPYGVSNLAALIGDSNTEHSFRATQAYWRNGLLGGVLDMRANSGKSGVTVLGLISQIDQLYTNGGDPGLQGLPPLGWVFIQAGTNGWRGVTSVDATMRSQWETLVNKCKLVAEHVVFIAMPPAGGVNTAKAAGYPVVRDYFREFVLADTSNRTHLIDGWGDVIDASGNIIPVYWLADEYHPSGAGARQVALSELSQMQALLANQGYARAPLVTNPADVYPAQPQWVNNPTGTGVVSFTGAWSGDLPTGWSIGNNGSGLGGTTAIIPAAAEDPNQVPWVRITPTTSSSFAQISLTFAAAGRTITSSDPSELEQLLEVRFNGLLNFNQLEYWIQNNTGNKFVQTAYLKWGEAIPPSETVVLRQRYYHDSTVTGGTPTAYIYLYSVVAASGSMGSIDIRCPSIRG